MNPPEPDRPTLLSVADILRREGLRGPHVAAQQLRPRGHVGPPVPTLSAPRPPGHGRAVLAVAALAVAGAVLGAAALHDAQTDRPDPGGADGTTGAAGGRAPGTDVPTTPAGTFSDLVALTTALPAAGPGTARPGDLPPVTRAGLAGLVAGGAPASPGARPAPGDATPGGGAAGPGGTGGTATGDGGVPGSGPGDGGGGSEDGEDGDGDGGPGDGDGPDGGTTTVELPELEAPDAVPAAPVVRPGAVAVEPDAVTVTGPSATTEPLRLGPVDVGRARAEAPEVELTTSDGLAVRSSEAEVETPALDVAGTELDPPDLATPTVELRLPLVGGE